MSAPGVSDLVSVNAPVPEFGQDFSRLASPHKGPRIIQAVPNLRRPRAAALLPSNNNLDVSKRGSSIAHIVKVSGLVARWLFRLLDARSFFQENRPTRCRMN